MTLDLKQSVKTDKQLIQEALLPYMLLIAMMDIPKDDGKHEAYKGRLGLLKDESIYYLLNLSKTRQRIISKKIGKITTNVIKKANPVSSYKELSVAICMAILDLVKQNKILDVGTQAVDTSIEILEEALNYGDWGDLKLAKIASNNIIRALHENGYFKEDLSGGISIKS